MKLNRAFYNQDTITVAKALLGNHLIHLVNGEERIGKIVEVEAYLGPKDLASHSSKGVTERTRIMFGPPGYAYVYLIYGIYHCFNIVTEGEGSGSAVLIRALEPIKNIGSNTIGPGLLCNAMLISRALNGHDLLSDNLYIAKSDETISSIIETARIGVHYAKEWAEKPFRFYIEGNVFVSKRPRK